ncbi:ABC transporter substrate-binding protein [Sporomusa acidovorans]|uniref:Aliphatic sulfonates-binding protein n=1 Tax=Sporomusa acidovorans (strain ATCC 49682 / DSM 3132 / Mol) TaxID=1123286 RepID=A0ABZ3J9B4_SPOA4|nr:ABC transporter substrate-binding protein [Sporomusa acidovorans]OZC22912.1 putative aliphatic sulfonates-binding protein precursor [Sporomusa acidovorans DSM 3132]SDE95442.1 NitT/TauT family transport system substrate-binding protein [Sporomusa acidovorans]
MKKKLVSMLLMAAMLAMVIAGCGGNKPAEKSASQSAEKKPVVIAYTPWTGYGSLFVAKEKGMFKNKGVDVELQAIEGVGDRKQALVAGKIQAMAASLDVSVSAAGEGVPMKFVWAFDSSNGADGLIVKKSKGIEKIADLKGKEVAFHRGSASHFLLSTLLEKNGLTDNDIKAVDMKASEAASAFMAGKVDAAVTWEPHLGKAKAAGETVLATTKDTPGLIADVLAFREDMVKNNPETVQAVVAALAEATDYMNKNPEETNKILADAFKMKPEEVAADIQTVKFYGLKENLEFYGSKEKPGAIYDVGKRAGEFYVKLKLLSQAPDLSKYIDDTFITKVK